MAADQRKPGYCAALAASHAAGHRPAVQRRAFPGGGEHHKPYPDEDAARQAAALLRRRQGRIKTAGLTCWRCPACRMWHVGKNRRFR